MGHFFYGDTMRWIGILFVNLAIALDIFSTKLALTKSGSAELNLNFNAENIDELVLANIFLMCVFSLAFYLFFPREKCNSYIIASSYRKLFKDSLRFSIKKISSDNDTQCILGYSIIVAIFGVALTRIVAVTNNFSVYVFGIGLTDVIVYTFNLSSPVSAFYITYLLVFPPCFVIAFYALKKIVMKPEPHDT